MKYKLGRISTGRLKSCEKPAFVSGNNIVRSGRGTRDAINPPLLPMDLIPYPVGFRKNSSIPPSEKTNSLRTLAGNTVLKYSLVNCQMHIAAQHGGRCAMRDVKFNAKS